MARSSLRLKILSLFWIFSSSTFFLNCANALSPTCKSISLIFKSVDYLNLIYDEFKCFDRIITKESHWNYKARNGNHYGLGQMANAMVLRLNPNQQIDLHIKYIKHRYGVDHQGYVNACKALRFFEVNHYH